MPHLSEIRIRDPFLLPLPKDRSYVMYGTTDTSPWSGPGTGFDCYRSVDLVEWDGPFAAFRPGPDFWGTKHFWAPEVVEHDGRYVMFATFATDDGARGTQALVSAEPAGPFEPWSEGALTPAGWMCLDGTLHVDEDGMPWLVFCHEWIQIGNGTVCAQRLSFDLRRAIGKPIVLFAASSAPWARPVVPGQVPGLAGEIRSNALCYVTDGPFLRRLREGTLVMLWSSAGESGYAMGVATSTSGRVEGPWVQADTPLWADDGGHGMLVDTFDGLVLLALHNPNQTPWERTVLREVRESAGTLEIVTTAPTRA